MATACSGGDGCGACRGNGLICAAAAADAAAGWRGPTEQRLGAATYAWEGRQGREDVRR